MYFVCLYFGWSKYGVTVSLWGQEHPIYFLQNLYGKFSDLIIVLEEEFLYKLLQFGGVEKSQLWGLEEQTIPRWGYVWSCNPTHQVISLWASSAGRLISCQCSNFECDMWKFVTVERVTRIESWVFYLVKFLYFGPIKRRKVTFIQICESPVQHFRRSISLKSCFNWLKLLHKA